MKSTQELANLINEEAGLDVKKLPLTTMFVWHAQNTPNYVALMYSADLPDEEKQRLIKSAKPTVFYIDAPVPLPGTNGLNVYALFENEEEMRVYAVPVVGDAYPPRLYRLSKNSVCAICSEQRMDWEAFVQLVAEEWTLVDSEMTAAEAAASNERDATVLYLKYLKEKGNPLSLDEMVQAIENEAHLDVLEEAEDEEEEPEAAANGATKANSPVEEVVARNS